MQINIRDVLTCACACLWGGTANLSFCKKGSQCFYCESLRVAAKGWASIEKGGQSQEHYVHEPISAEGHRLTWQVNGQFPGKFGPGKYMPVAPPTVALTHCYRRPADTTCSHGHGCRMVF